VTAGDAPYPLLLSPWRVGPLHLRNRAVLSPMTTGFGFEEGRPTEQFIAYMRARTADTGLATVAFGAVHPRGRVERQIPEMWHADAGARLQPLVAAIHAGGGAACLQLGHGGRQVSPKVIGQPPVAPSAVAPQVHVDVSPVALSTAEVEEIVAAFGHAAAQAAAAGFDAIELHGGHGYLVQQFLSAESNRREDRYGGADIASRARFGVEVIQSIREAAPDLALLVRINGDDLVPGGMTRSDAAAAATAFADAGAHAIVVSAGVYGSVPYTIPLLDDPEATFVEACRTVKSAVTVPVVAVGRISTPASAERLLAAGHADAVALGRALLADPQWIAKAASGRPGDIRPCIATVQGCAGMLQHGDPISCSVNPDVGREYLPAVPAPAPRRVTVVGGGVAGLEAARRAAELGHTVTLFERQARLGGALVAAAATPPLRHLDRLLHWFERQLEDLGVDVRVGVAATTDAVAATAPDLVVVAVGAAEAPPAIDGYEHLPAWTGTGVLTGEPSSLGPRSLPGRVVVVGAGQRALATALWCVSEGTETTLLATGRTGMDTSGLARRALLQRLDRTGVTVLTGRPAALTPDGVVLDDGTLVAGDGVVFTEPLRPEPGDALVPAGVASVRVGDARDPRDMASAIAEARDAIDADARAVAAT
jgi:2,4-dienoyl-CoA reductase-like NADH-dependent reductase (Old Yellow Enzyme family)/thioredoxin reductase